MSTTVKIFTRRQLINFVDELYEKQKEIAGDNDIAGQTELWVSWYEYIFNTASPVINLGTSLIATFFEEAQVAIERLILELEAHEDLVQIGDYDGCKIEFTSSKVLGYDIPDSSEIIAFRRGNGWILNK